MQITRWMIVATTIILLSVCPNRAEIREVNPKAVFAMDDYEGKLTVHFFHLVPTDRTERTGESIFIRTPKGKTILIDAGKPMVGPLIDGYLNEMNIEKIDFVMPSHPHIDHIGGYLTLFKTKEIGKIIETNFPVQSEIYNEYQQVIEEEGIHVEHAEKGDVIELEEDLILEFLNPAQDTIIDYLLFDNLSAGIVNDLSMVFKLTYKEKRFLFTGDIYSGIENLLVKSYGDELDVDVLVAPHHGMGTSSSNKLIETVNPEITLIPTNLLIDQSVYNNYLEHGSEVYVSQFDGNILLVTDGKKVDIFTEIERDKEENDVNQVDDTGLLSPNRILNIAHRGASGHAPEHTLVSYETGEEMISDYIEIDLQMTIDGELIAMHDSDVARTTDGLGLVKDLTLEEIKVLDAGTWFNDENSELAKPVFSNLKIPTLDEIIEKFGTDANYYIETKTPEEHPNMVKTLVLTLQEHELIGPDVPEGKVIIQSFSKESLLEAKKLEPSIPLIQLISYEDTAIISKDELNKIKEYAIGIGANFKFLNQDYIKEVRNAELLLHPYTVNDPKDMEQLIEWGVTGMFTNYPDRLNEVLEKMDNIEEN